MHIHLAWSFFKIGLLSFGGGYGMIPLIQREVEKFGVTGREFIDILAVSQMTPGPIGINTATYTGYRVAGPAGSCVATFFCVLPGFILMSVVSRYFYAFRHHPRMELFFRNIRPVFIALIAASVALMVQDIRMWNNPAQTIIFALAFAAAFFLKIHPIAIIVLAGAAGYFLF